MAAVGSMTQEPAQHEHRVSRWQACAPFLLIGLMLLAGYGVRNYVSRLPAAAESRIIPTLIAPTPEPRYPTQIRNGGFERGTDEWIHGTPHRPLIRQAADAHSGQLEAFVGGLTKITAYLSQNVSIPAERPYLSYWYKIDSRAPVCKSSTGYGYDAGGISFQVPQGRARDEMVLCEDSDTHDQWLHRLVNLRAYVGRDIELSVYVVNQSDVPSAIHIDDVELVAGP